MGILFIILIVLLLELIQIQNSRFKIRKWILPIFSLLNSIGILISMFVFEKHDILNNKLDSITLLSNILYFAIFNIPTLVFIITNYILNKKQVIDKSFFNKVKLFIIIILIFIIILFISMQIFSSKNITTVNKENINNELNI